MIGITLVIGKVRLTIDTNACTRRRWGKRWRLWFLELRIIDAVKEIEE